MYIKNFKLLTLITLSAFIWSCGEKQNNQQQQQGALQVKGYKVVGMSFNSEVKTTANILANEQVELKAPIAGQVLSIYFEEGTTVQKGQPIVRIDDRAWKAQLVGLEAALETAKKDYERKKELLDIEGSSQQEVDNAFSAWQTLKSQVEQLKVNIDLANVKAPFSGKLGMRNFSEGSFLTQGQTITTLTEIHRLKVDFSVAQNHMNSLAIGKKVTVLIENDTLEAEIYAISPLINNESRTINVRALLQQNDKQHYLPGVFAEVIITTDFLDNALMVPTQAVVPSITDQTVYIVKDGKAQKKIVQIGNRTKDMVHITDGIAEGDVVLTTGLLHVKDGMPVAVEIITEKQEKKQ